ncbi:mitochondrial ribosomal protein L23 [Rhodofomes roseus]|uniref:Large ribosomal subunit protein uL23m n=1 Tax=Rhodofomes roseus TaxID=34475 RepID=A0ABQ8K188_9APHY|nr:mitochondrial ribosomal protein L23 [Rhodofomes roseus]KAH9829998.1 mitochondrial ribosomal protein L23 [Rhodofomes roseus]
MHPCFRRLYAAIPDAAAVARTTSTPRSVRLRRLRIKKTKHPNLPVESDATPEGLTPTELARYNRASAKGELLQDNGENLTEGEWLERLNERRSRLRGVREVVDDTGKAQEQVVGQKIYLPNIIIRLVRNHTPPGQPYNPYEATFRLPPSMTKTDLRSYLSAVYGVKTTYIRTDNYLSPLTRDLRTGSWTRTRAHKTYKRAVVGLVEPFYYPLAMEDMSAEEREQREDWLEQHFQIKEKAALTRIEMLRLQKGPVHKLGAPTSRADILHHLAERRAVRERAVEQAKVEMQTERQVERQVEEAAPTA